MGITPTASSPNSCSEEWCRKGLGAEQLSPKISDARITNLLFIQCGFVVDQYGGVTKAAVCALRNAIEFSSISGVIETIPGGKSKILIQVKLGVPPENKVVSENEETGNNHTDSEMGCQKQRSAASVYRPMKVDLTHVAEEFPHGKLLEVEVVVGGLSFSTGIIVQELGDKADIAVCVLASVSVGFDNGTRKENDDEILNQDATTTNTSLKTEDGF